MKQMQIILGFLLALNTWHVYAVSPEVFGAVTLFTTLSSVEYMNRYKKRLPYVHNNKQAYWSRLLFDTSSNGMTRTAVLTSIIAARFQARDEAQKAELNKFTMLSLAMLITEEFLSHQRVQCQLQKIPGLTLFTCPYCTTRCGECAQKKLVLAGALVIVASSAGKAVVNFVQNS